MVDDHHDFYHAIAQNLFLNPALAREISLQWEYWHQIHLQIARCLYQTSKLKGFSRTLFPGTAQGHDPSDSHLPLPSWIESLFGMTAAYSNSDDMLDEEDGETLPKEVVADADLVVQLFENISLQDNHDINTYS